MREPAKSMARTETDAQKSGEVFVPHRGSRTPDEEAARSFEEGWLQVSRARVLLPVSAVRPKGFDCHACVGSFRSLQGGRRPC